MEIARGVGRFDYQLALETDQSSWIVEIDLSIRLINHYTMVYICLCVYNLYIDFCDKDVFDWIC